MNNIADAIQRSTARCPGYRGIEDCTCCRPGCDCGCRDDCPAFRAAIQREQKREAIDYAKWLSEDNKRSDNEPIT